LSDEQVVDFLRRHPDFLARHPELFEVLTPPDRTEAGNVVDFQQMMIERLKDENGRLRADHRELVKTTRSNLQSQNRVHAATLDLMNARSFEHFVETITTDLAIHLQVDARTLCLEHDEEGPMPRTRSGVRLLPVGAVDRLLGGAVDYRMRPSIEGERAVYGGVATLVRSDALIRLSVSDASPPGLLAVGAREPDHFAPDQGPDLLLFLARVIESTARAWLDLPA